MAPSVMQYNSIHVSNARPSEVWELKESMKQVCEDEILVFEP
jgi:hypothetical protein